MKKLLKYLYLLFVVPIILVVLYLNISLFHTATCHKTKEGFVNTEVVHQLNFIKTKIDEGAADQMQGIYPEGFVFMHSLYALAWADVAETLKPNTELYKKAVREINSSYKALNSENGKSIFPKEMILEYGVFYRGWTNYVLAKKLSIMSENQRDTTDVQIFEQNCEAIMTAFEKSEHTYLPSYYGQAWQADNVVALASVACYDKIIQPQYTERIARQFEKIKSSVDTKTNLIGHFYDFETRQSSPPRGSSQSLINNFLFDIDTAFAKSQIKIYKDLFLTYRLGLPGIREYPKGTTAYGDIDSGPVIWQVGGSASIVGIRTMGLADETAVYKGLRNSVQGFGVGWKSADKKQFIFGQLPMADAFIAWANAKNCQVNQKSGYWQWKFQIISIVISVFFGFIHHHFSYK